ncbi:WD repeat-containing protein 20-like [Achroia grisella]|uniref:WD repeat-containing protein 20-like n=1 Tax=Achroia grisella TaxID=688607 RepID=UPI0027D2B59F|nr:WD repeat-containing protein 20-like [Achroia grisella]XP_059058285.1 WD repeat-containing protein 20-like [Achroia grisella]
MAVQPDSGGKDDVKTQFVTREGTYRLMTLSEYSRPNRVGYTSGSGSSHVRVSLVSLPPGPGGGAPGSDGQGSDDRICFNHGKELYVYVYRGVKKAADLTKPVDKKMYKGTNPTCHDFNTVTMTADSVSLVIGFSTGQIQLIDPIKKELSKLYNEERLIDKTRVTCIRWVPGSSNLFITAHASGQLYVYNEELSCGTTAPHYQLFKQGDGYSIHTCRTKSTRNPLYRWVIGAEGSCINEFAFSPCGTNLAVASQDGFLRVFHYDTMELIGRARSYFGGFLCVCWSPDGKYVVVGGEDDLVTVWCFSERKVVARGQGHRSWVSVVAFDPYVVSFTDPESDEGVEDDRQKSESVQCYRLGSVSQDTQLCLWDLTEDVLRPPVRARASAHLSPNSQTFSPNGVPGMKVPAKGAKSNKIGHKHAELSGQNNPSGESSGAKQPAKTKVNNVSTLNISVGKAKEESSGSLGVNSLTQRLAGFSFGDRRSEHRRNFSLTKPAEQKSSASNTVALRGKSAGAPTNDPFDPLKLIGTASCPRFDECPVLEPLVCKKVAHERLTALLFRSEYFVTACADGCVNTWARPARSLNGEPRPLRRFEKIDLVD